MQRTRRLAAGAVALALFGIGAPALAVDDAALAQHVTLDPSVDPCDDFFAHVCKPWNAANPIPPDQSRWGRFDVLALRNREALKGLLEEAAAHPTPESAKVGDYYAACLDEATVESKGVAVLKPELDGIAALSSKHDLAALLAHLQQIGVNVFFEFGAEPDDKDSSIEIAGLDQGGLGLPDRDYYTKTDPKSIEQREAYRGHVARMLTLLGDQPDAAKHEADAVLTIETALAEGALNRVERRNPEAVYHKLPKAELAKLASDFDWTVYFTDTSVPGFDSLNISEPKFVEALGKALDAASLDDIKSYLRWHLVHRAAASLPKVFVDENFDFYGKKLSGAKELEPRWRRCVKSVDGGMGEALGKLYVDRYYTADAKARTEQLIADLRAAFDADLHHLDWMDAKTKKIAIEKLAAMTQKIGYPAKWRDYSTLEIRRDDMLGNSYRATAFETHRDLKKIGGPVDRSEWGMTPPTVNAYYDPQNNDINFPAGIFQPPFFDAKGDDAYNYGAIGTVIGHEMTHGFDDEGRQFDAKGNLVDWWTKGDEERFNKRAACLVNEYGGFTAVDDVKLNGKLTLGENTADNGGIRLALAAYERHLKETKAPDQTIDGLTGRQRFFVGFAQVWCGDARPESRRLLALTDPHSPEHYRVNGVVSNLESFRQAFHCPVGKPMAPKDMCRVW